MRECLLYILTTAKDQHLQGVVVLKGNIDKQSNVTDTEIVNEDPALSPAAIEAVRKWKYHPFTQNGVPLAMETQLSVTFTLSK